jgi:hypothetical protein
MARLKCAACGQRIGIEERAAKDADGKSYCFPCWDSSDEIALNMYRGSQGYDDFLNVLVEWMHGEITDMVEQHGSKE